MDDERARRRRGLWVLAIGYPLVTLAWSLAVGRPRDGTLGSFAGAVIAMAVIVAVFHDERRAARVVGWLRENRYRFFAWTFGGFALLIVLVAALRRDAAFLVGLPVPVVALLVTFIAGRRASGA